MMQVTMAHMKTYFQKKTPKNKTEFPKILILPKRPCPQIKNL